VEVEGRGRASQALNRLANHQHGQLSMGNTPSSSSDDHRFVELETSLETLNSPMLESIPPPVAPRSSPATLSLALIPYTPLPPLPPPPRPSHKLFEIDELLYLILSYLPPSLSLLSVSTHFYHAGLPLLYKEVVLREGRDALSFFANAARGGASNGRRFVRRLTICCLPEDLDRQEERGSPPIRLAMGPDPLPDLAHLSFGYTPFQWHQLVVIPSMTSPIPPVFHAILRCLHPTSIALHQLSEPATLYRSIDPLRYRVRANTTELHLSLLRTSPVIALLKFLFSRPALPLQHQQRSHPVPSSITFDRVFFHTHPPPNTTSSLFTTPSHLTNKPFFFLPSPRQLALLAPSATYASYPSIHLIFCPLHQTQEKGDDHASLNPWDRRIGIIRAAGQYGNEIGVQGVSEELREETRVEVERSGWSGELRFAEEGKGKRKRAKREKEIRDIPDL
jgi:hypothetical protein